MVAWRVGVDASWTGEPDNLELQVLAWAGKNFCSARQTRRMTTTTGANVATSARLGWSQKKEESPQDRETKNCS